jgi:peptidoglycan/LPS O-acetylase OafA/YrhL
MSKPTSNRLSKLEAIRGLAAAYVAISHLAIEYFGVRQPAIFAQGAVMLFFIMSGFVICYSTGRIEPGQTPRGGFKDYFIKRFRRIVPLFVMAMGLGYLADSYVAGSWLSVDRRTLLGNLAMLQDALHFKPGVYFDTFHNGPAWSLSYEWWYYMMFFPLLIAPVAWRVRKYIVFALAALAFVSSALVIPDVQKKLGLGAWHSFGFANFLLLFPVWWAGVEMAREYQETSRVTILRQLPSVVALWLFTFAFAAWYAMPQHHLYADVGGIEREMKFEAGELKHFGFAAVLLTGGLLWNALGWPLFAKTVGLFERLAPISYGIYIIHMPVLFALKASPLNGHPWLFVPAFLLGVGVLSYLLEVVVQGRINAVTRPLLSRSRASPR